MSPFCEGPRQMDRSGNGSVTSVVSRKHSERLARSSEKYRCQSVPVLPGSDTYGRVNSAVTTSPVGRLKPRALPSFSYLQPNTRKRLEWIDQF